MNVASRSKSLSCERQYLEDSFLLRKFLTEEDYISFKSQIRVRNCGSLFHIVANYRLNELGSFRRRCRDFSLRHRFHTGPPISAGSFFGLK
jgi:hypothetical protein